METNKKQTAVDWLKEQFKIQYFFDTIKTQEDENFINSLFDQAKQMEREQIENAYVAQFMPEARKVFYKDAVKYYEKTYSN